MTRDQLPVIRLADIEHLCCAPDCERTPDPELPLPLCSGCYELVYRHAFKDVAERVGPSLEKIIGPLEEARQMRWRRQLNEAEAAERSARSVVYILRFGDRYKIGFSTNLRLRLDTVPHDEVIVTFPGGRTEERALHQRFGAHRLIGEWFAINDETTAMVQSLIDWQARQAG